MSVSVISRTGACRVNIPVPSADQVKIEDIAHSLSNQCRFNGWLSTFFSVGQHSVEVAALVVEEAKAKRYSAVDVARAGLAGLLHDAPEYVIGDIISPLKHEIGDPIVKIERKVEVEVFAGLGVAKIMAAHADIVRWADEEMVVSDMARWGFYGSTRIRGVVVEITTPGVVPPPFELRFGSVAAWPPIIARETFLKRYRELRREAKL